MKTQSGETYIKHRGHSLSAQRQQGEKQASQQSNKKLHLLHQTQAERENGRETCNYSSKGTNAIYHITLKSQ